MHHDEDVRARSIGARSNYTQRDGAMIVDDPGAAPARPLVLRGRNGAARRAGRFAPLAPILVATVLIFWRLGHNSYWVDEADSLAFAALPWDQLRVAVRHLDAVFVLYYALLHVWLAMFGAPLAGRVLSALCGVASVPLVYALGVRLYDRPAALVGSLLYAVSFACLEPAREVRMYALLTLCVSASWLALLRLFERPSPPRALMYAAWLGLALWVHPFGALTALAQGLLCLAWWRRRAAATISLAAIAVAIIAALPLFMLARLNGSGQIDWIERPSLHAAWIALRDGSGSSVAAFVGAALVLWSAVLVVRERSPGRFALLAWTFVPPLAAFAISAAVKPIFTWRYLVEIAPAASLLIGGLVMRVPPRVRAGLGVVLACSTLVTLHGLSRYQREDWWSLGADLRRHAQANDALAIYPPGFSVPYALARQRELRNAPALTLLYPSPVPPVWKDTTKRNDAVPAFAPGHSRFWIITQTGAFGDRADAALEPRYRRDFADVGGLVTLAHYTAR